jgi:isoleucyl-tRNA synthetase
MENRDKQEEILVGSVEELYNEIESRSLRASKENPFKGLKLETWTTATMI